MERSDQRYCSEPFEIRCDNDERVRVAFSLDCCDRQAIAFAATTVGISGEFVRDVMVKRSWSASDRCQSYPRQQNG